MKAFLLVVCAFSLMSSQCKKPDDPTLPDDRANPAISVKFEAVANNNPLVFNDPVTNSNGQKYLINYLSFYAGNPRLVKTDGTEVLLKDVVLVNFDDNINKNDPTHDPAGTGTSFSFSVSAGTYKAIRFGIGVPKSLQPPQTGKTAFDYSSGSPLAFDRGMYWDPWDMYRATIISGRVDTNKVASGTPDWPFGYHTGYDSLYREVELADNFTIDKGQTHAITIQLDVNKIFYNSSYTTDLYNESYTHMSTGNLKEGRLGVKITNSLVLALSKK